MKAILLGLALIVALSAVPTAQNAGGRFAYDRCEELYWIDDNGWNYAYTCSVYAFDIGGSGIWVGEGFDPALSPDGTRIAFVVGAAGPGHLAPDDIVVVDLRDKTYSNLTANDPAPASSPAWSWDGRLAFESSRSGSPELYVMNADGTGLAQLTNGSGFLGHPTWSPDGRIAFECTGTAGEQNLCSINADGTGFHRLTGPGGNDREPAFSHDGTRIAFVTSRVGGLAALESDGTITPLANESGSAPSWSPDGRQLWFFRPEPLPGGGGACPADGSPCGPPYMYASIYVLDLATTGVSRWWFGANPGWALTPPGGFPPEARFTFDCTLLTCRFDGSPSVDDGDIASYTWRFDDGSVQTGSTSLHTYPRGGTYTVELLVVDDYGLRGTSTRTFVVTGSPPIASFTRVCSGLICQFDGSGSSDPDGQVVAYAWSFGDGATATAYGLVGHLYAPGTYTVSLTVTDNAGVTSSAASAVVTVANAPPVATFGSYCDSLNPVCSFSGGMDPDGHIVTYAWNFGDGTTGAGSNVTHTYANAGTYNVTLTVTDNYGATDSRSTSVTVVKVVLHVGDLESMKDVQKKYWTAYVIIRIHDADHRPWYALVDGIWSAGQSGDCWIDGNTMCVYSIVPTSTASVTFTVRGVRFTTAPYDATRNHDADGDTNGSTITVTRR